MRNMNKEVPENISKEDAVIMLLNLAIFVSENGAKAIDVKTSNVSMHFHMELDEGAEISPEQTEADPTCAELKIY